MTGSSPDSPSVAPRAPDELLDALLADGPRRNDAVRELTRAFARS